MDRSFVNTISTAFSVSQCQFDPFPDWCLLSNDTNDTDGTIDNYTITFFVDSESQPIVNGVNHTVTLSFDVLDPHSIVDWHFDQYVEYDFLKRYLSLELLSNDSSQIVLSDLEWIDPPDVDEQEPWVTAMNKLFGAIVTFLTYVFGCILSISCLVVIAGYIHSWISWNCDLAVGNAVFFCFAMFDWYSDILFTFTIDAEWLVLWVISFSLLIFPLIGNVYWLVRQQKAWEEDGATGARTKNWLARWRPFLYSLTVND